MPACGACDGDMASRSGRGGQKARRADAHWCALCPHLRLISVPGVRVTRVNQECGDANFVTLERASREMFVLRAVGL